MRTGGVRTELEHKESALVKKLEKLLIYPHDSVINEATVFHVVEVAVLDGGDEISGGTTVGTDSGHEPLRLQGLRKTAALRR